MNENENNVMNNEVTKKDQVINWVKNHKKQLIIGAGVTVTAILTVIIVKRCGSSEEVAAEAIASLAGDTPELPDDGIDYDQLLEDIYYTEGANMYNAIVDDSIDNYTFDTTYQIGDIRKKLTINVDKIEAE